jgi:VCBS repeat-containing protein
VDVDTTNTHSYTVTPMAAGQGSVAIVALTGEYTYNPGSDFQNLADGETTTVSFDVTIEDVNGDSDTETVTVTIKGTNDGPVAQADSFTGTEDISLSGNLLVDNGAGADSDVDSDAVLSVQPGTFTSANGGTVTLQGNGDFTYSPMADFNGSDSFDYTLVDNHSETDTATASIAVNAVNDAPVASNDTTSTDEDTAININVLGNDSDVDSTMLSASVGPTSAQGATLSVNVDGTINYNPASSASMQAMNTGQSVVDTFNYSLSDGNGGTDTAVVSVTVNGDNDAGAGAFPDSGATNEDTTTFINVLANDVGNTITGLQGGSTLSAISDLGASVSVDFGSNGSVTYAPQGSAILQALSAGDSVTDTFSYTSVDGAGVESTATVTVTVAGLAESLISDSGVVNEVMGFDSLTGNPGGYTEDHMTVTSLYPGGAHIHDSGDDIMNHSGCCSTPYEFTYNNAGDTSFSMASFTNVGGNSEWINSNNGSMYVSGAGTVNLDSTFENVQWVRWIENSGSSYIDDVMFSA